MAVNNSKKQTTKDFSISSSSPRLRQLSSAEKSTVIVNTNKGIYRLQYLVLALLSTVTMNFVLTSKATAISEDIVIIPVEFFDAIEKLDLSSTNLDLDSLILTQTDSNPDEEVPSEVNNPESSDTVETNTEPTETTEETTPTPTTQETNPANNTTEVEQPQEEPRVLVAEVFVAGVEGELENLVYNVIRTNPGRTTTRSRLQEDINAIYATGYFSNVTVTPEDTQYGVKITYMVTPNPTLERIVIQTLPEGTEESIVPPEIVQEIFSEQYGTILNLRDLQEGITKLNQWYTDSGYDLAQVVGSPNISPDGTVTLVIAEGRLETIRVRYFDKEDEEVKGKTREFIVTREVKLKPGDVFNRKTAQQDLQRVFGLGIFEDVRLSFSPSDDPSKVIMNVDVVETNTGSLAAGAGISSTSGLFGTVSYQQRNLGGNHQTLGTEIQVGQRELLFDASFQDPWIGGDPYRTSYTANVFRRRSISLVYDGTDTTSIRTEDGNDSPRVVRTGGGVTFTRPLAADVFTRADWVLSAGVQYQHIEIQNADGDLSARSADSFGNQKLAFNNGGVDDVLVFKVSASQDTRDNGLRPTDGSLLLVGMDQSAPLSGNGILYNRLRASYSYYLPLKLINFDFTEGPQALAFNFQSGTVLGDLPPYEAFVIGGSTSVRGYGEGDLGNGRSYVQATAEYRFPIFSVVGGAIFFDYGSNIGSEGAVIGKPSEVRGLNGSGYGYGLGVRVQSPVGPIRVDYAINDEGESRVHFGIGEKF